MKYASVLDSKFVRLTGAVGPPRKSADLILRAARSAASRRMIQHAVAPPLRSGASFETRLRRSSGRGGWDQMHNTSESGHQSALLLGLRGDRPTASPPPLWGTTKEGGRAVLRDKRAAAHSIISPVRATPRPGPPPQEGAGALTPSILPKCSRLWCPGFEVCSINRAVSRRGKAPTSS
jgi:hypothetical protein